MLVPMVLGFLVCIKMCISYTHIFIATIYISGHKLLASQFLIVWFERRYVTSRKEIYINA